MTTRDKLGMSLDDIIRLNKRRTGDGNVMPRGTQRTQGRRGRMNIRGTGGVNTRGFGRSNFRGRGGSNSRGRGISNNRAQGNIIRRNRSDSNSRIGGSSNRGRGMNNRRGGDKNRGGGTNNRSRGIINRSGAIINRSGGIINRSEGIINRSGGIINRSGGIINRGGGIINRGGGTNNRGRGTNNRGRGINSRGVGRVYVRGGRNQIESIQRGARGFQRGNGFRGNQNVTSSFRSDQILRQQALQQKLNRARTLKQLMTKSSVSGASDTLTVCIPNDLAVKRQRRSSSVPRLGTGSNYGRDTFVRRGNNSSYLNRQRSRSRSRSRTRGVSPEASVVSRRSRASSVGRNRVQRSSSVGRSGILKQNRGQVLVEQYAPLPNWQSRTSGLNLQLQKEIAAIQGKSFIPSTNAIGFSNGTNEFLGLSEFRPVPTLTGTTLNDRFS